MLECEFISLGKDVVIQLLKTAFLPHVQKEIVVKVKEITEYLRDIITIESQLLPLGLDQPPMKRPRIHQFKRAFRELDV